MPVLSIRDAYTWLVILGTIVTLAVIIFGFVISKSSKGRQLYDKLTSLNSMIQLASQAAVSHASQLENATGAEKKDSAVAYAKEYLTSKGFSINAETESLIANIIEKIYQTEYKVLQYSYNVGLSTNTDSSKNEAFADKDKDGVPDFLEPSKIDLKKGTVTVAKSGTPAISTTVPVSTDVIPKATKETSSNVDSKAAPSADNTTIAPVSDSDYPVADTGINSL